MKKITTFAAVLVAVLMISATAAHAADNTYSGITVVTQGLHAEARSVTDGKGNATFRDLKPDSYTFLLPDTSKLKPGTQLTFTITVTGAPPITGTVEVPLRGRATPTYLLDKSGQKMLVRIKGTNTGALVINLSIFDRWGNL